MNNNDVKVSVIVPAYNCEDTLEKCVESLINQTLRNIQIIIINDGSTDNTSEVMDELSKKDSRIICIYQDNRGVSYTRNLGIRFALGEFIGFVDSDDYVDITMYEKLYNLAKVENSHMALCKFCFSLGNEIFEKEQDWIDLIDDDNVAESVFLNMIAMNDEETFNKRETIMGSSCRCIYKNNIINENNIFFDEEITYAEDLLFNLSYLDKIDKISIVNEALYYYKKKSGSLSLAYRENFETSIRNLINKISNIALSHNIGNRMNYLWFGYMIEIIRNVTRKIYFIDLKKLKQTLKIVKDKENKSRLADIDFHKLTLKNKFFYLLFYKNSMGLGGIFYVFRSIKYTFITSLVN